MDNFCFMFHAKSQQKQLFGMAASLWVVSLPGWQCTAVIFVFGALFNTLDQLLESALFSWHTGTHTHSCSTLVGRAWLMAWHCVPWHKKNAAFILRVFALVFSSLFLFASTVFFVVFLSRLGLYRCHCQTTKRRIFHSHPLSLSLSPRFFLQTCPPSHQMVFLFFPRRREKCVNDACMHFSCTGLCNDETIKWAAVKWERRREKYARTLCFTLIFLIFSLSFARSLVRSILPPIHWSFLSSVTLYGSDRQVNDSLRERGPRRKRNELMHITAYFAGKQSWIRWSLVGQKFACFAD